MFEMKINCYRKHIENEDIKIRGFDKPLIFYYVHKDDQRPFFVTFIIVDIAKQEITYIFSYNEENKKIVEAQVDNKIYSMLRCVHCSLSVKEGEDFLTFMEEESFFFYVNYKDNYIMVYTMNDLVKDKNIDFQRISSTLYKDDCDPEYFYMSAVDKNNELYFYRVSLDLKQIEKIDSFMSNMWPPHVVRKYKNHLFVSHEFKYPMYKSEVTEKIVTPQELAYMILKQSTYFMITNKSKADLSESKKQILLYLKNIAQIKCLPGKIMMMNLDNKEKQYYVTSGGSPAHFEIDEANNTLYTSSHNFLMDINNMILYEPAVIDKFEIHNTELLHTGSFTYPKGYRYTTHKVFSHGNKTYICTFGEPNRLIFIKAATMEMFYYYDVEEDVLSNIEDASLFVNTQSVNSFSYVALEVSEDGETIIFHNLKYLYFFSFTERRIFHILDYTFYNEEMGINLEAYNNRTVHYNFLK